MPGSKNSPYSITQPRHFGKQYFVPETELPETEPEPATGTHSVRRFARRLVQSFFLIKNTRSGF